MATPTTQQQQSSGNAVAANDDDKDVDDYIVTSSSQCYVSRKATIDGATKVELKGRSVLRSGCVLQGNLAPVRIGRYCLVGQNTKITPPPKPAPQGTSNKRPQQQYLPVLIGDHVDIGKNCDIRAAAIGSYCRIGDNVKLGNRVIVKDCCVVGSNVVLGDDTIVPPFTRLQAPPAAAGASGVAATAAAAYRWSLPQFMTLPPATGTMMQERTMTMYQDFVAEQQQQRQSSKTTTTT